MNKKLPKSQKRYIRLQCIVNESQAKEIKRSAKQNKLKVSSYLLECHKLNITK